MLQQKKYCYWLILLLVCSQQLYAQNFDSNNSPAPWQLPGNEKPAVTGSGPPGGVTSALFIVRNIFITGNRKTRADIILRELPFKTGEHYLLQELVKKFEDSRRQLMNTALFHEVVVALKSFEGYNVDIMVDVKERWYIFPVPYLKPVDRNINQWIVEQKANLDRVNYGVKLLYNNASGRNDKLRFWLTNGYTKQISFSYDRLYIDKKLKWGMNVGFAIGKNREVNYNTIDDKQVFLKDNNNYIRSFVNALAEITYRRAIKTRHRFGIAYTLEDVKDTVVALNPSYFKSGRNRIQFPELYYNMTYYDLDYIPYPTKGYATEINVDKKGFNNVINVWQLSVKGSASWHLLPKIFLNIQGYGTIKLPFKQPYFTQRLLGYGDTFMQGYEYYVIDGVAGGYLKTSINRELLNFNIKVPERKGKEQEHIPVRIFAKIYANAGYVYNPQPGVNLLSNTMLYSGGFGVDIVTFYDFTIKLEWTFNQLGQNGLFLHRKSIF
jgi:outer membrane protein assembly factor BamA